MYDQNRSDGPRSEGERPGGPGRRISRDHSVSDPAPTNPGDSTPLGAESYRFDPRARRRRYADEEDNHPVNNQPVPNEADDTIEYPAVEVAETHPGAPATRHPMRPSEDPAVPGVPMNPYDPRAMPENPIPGTNHETADLRQPPSAGPPSPPPYSAHSTATPPDLRHAQAQYRPPAQATPPADVAAPTGVGNPSPGPRNALPVTQPGEPPQPPQATPPPDPSAHAMTDMEGTAHPQMSASPGNSQPPNPTPPPNPEPPPVAVRTINLSIFDLAPDQTRLIPALQDIPGVNVAELAEDPEGNGQLLLEIDPTMEEGPLRIAVQGVLTDQLMSKPDTDDAVSAEPAAASIAPQRNRTTIPRSQRGQSGEAAEASHTAAPARAEPEPAAAPARPEPARPASPAHSEPLPAASPPETPSPPSGPPVRSEERQLRRRQRAEAADTVETTPPQRDAHMTSVPDNDTLKSPSATDSDSHGNANESSTSVAPTEVDDDHHVEVRTEPLPGRFLLKQLDTTTANLETEVTITLECDDVASTGAALSPAIDWHVHRATAVAALEALKPYLPDETRVEIEHVSIETSGPVNVALVVVLTMGGDAIQRRAGAAVVTADRRQAIVSATLSALAVQMAQLAS